MTAAMTRRPIQARNYLACTLLSLVSSLMGVANAANAAPQIQVSDLGTLGGRFTVVNDVNKYGAATGYSETATGQIHAFLYSLGAIHDLGTLGGSGGSLGSAINDSGQVTGFAVTAAGEQHAFLYNGSVMIDLGTAGTTSSGNAINQSGQVAGTLTPSGGQPQAAVFTSSGGAELGALGSTSSAESMNAQGQVSGNYSDATGSHVFLYTRGSLVDVVPGLTSSLAGIRTLNSAGAIAGNYQQAGVQRGFLYANGQLSDLGSLGGAYTVTTAISESGSITGISAQSNGQRDAFLYSGGTLHDLGTLGGTLSVGYALNGQDQVTGQSATADGSLHAFASQGGALVDVGQSVAGLAPGTVTQSTGVGITDSGQVIGRYLVSTPSDTQMPTTTRSFIASIGTATVSNLFQTLLSSVTGVGPGLSLVSKVDQALAFYLIGATSASCSSLNASSNEVSAQNGASIPPPAAAQLLQQLSNLEGAIGCSP